MSATSSDTMPAVGSILQQRAKYSGDRIEEIRNEIRRRVPDLEQCPDLSIYTTGSFGRREAGRHSDLDLFFVLDDKGDPKASVPKLVKTLIDADLIRMCRDLNFPPFSKDGIYLKVHTITSLSKKIGDQHEDSENLFTARMLLFLESTPVHNIEVYEKAIKACRDEYFRDQKDHQDNFRPLFLANDIARFWKTLCLNYEAARTNSPDADKPKHRLKNFKLKHSRMMTCFSMLACLCDREESDTPEKLSRLVALTPTDRLKHINDKHRAMKSELTDIHSELLRWYEWFLTATDREEGDAQRWVDENKQEVQEKGHRFGDFTFEFLKKIAEAAKVDLRYLVV